MTSARAFGRHSPVRRALLAGISFYSRAISPALPARCRFFPTCSAYAAEAIEVHGLARGAGLALVRLVKCAPWHPGGLDPVPAAAGAGPHGHPSEPTASAEAAASRAHRPARATPPAMRRAGQEESSVV